MPIRNLSDTIAAYDEGRYHVQRFFKGANSVSNVPPLWTDWSYAAGQPAYDARIGTAGQFNPYVATKNDAVWFPEIPDGQKRHLKRIVLRTQAASTGQTTTNAVIYDLLGVYPLIDGDSTDAQDFTNDNQLPRYSDGVGVFPVLVNHVSPQIVNAGGTMTYVGSDDVERTVEFGVLLGAPGHVVSCPTTVGAASANARGPLTMSLHSGASGVKRVTSLTFSTAPGGLYAIYMIKPLTTIINCDGASTADKIATEKFLSVQNAWHYPRIYDGAWLGMFLSANAQTFAGVYGYMEFIWSAD